jgi:hypothetical protein
LKLRADEVSQSARVLPTLLQQQQFLGVSQYRFLVGLCFLLCLFRAMLGLDKGRSVQRTFVDGLVYNRSIKICSNGSLRLCLVGRSCLLTSLTVFLPSDGMF